MRFTDISIVFALSTVAAAAPQPDGEKTLYKVGQSPRYILARGPGEKVLHKGSATQLLARQSSGETGSAGDSDYCYGSYVTCASCFGTNWTECPDDITCYDVTDPTSTCDDSYSGGSDSGSSSDGSSGGSSGGSAGDSDYCYGADATCVSCFGSGYLECSDGFTCYDPSDPTTSCPDGTSGGSSSGSGTGSGSSSGSGAGSGLIGSSTTTTAAETTATPDDSGSIGTIPTEASSTHSSVSTTSSTSTTATSAATSAPSPISGNTLGGTAAGISIPMGLSAGAGAAVLVAAALM